MTSLRLRLFLLVLTATALVWSAAAVWTVIGAREDIEQVLDRRLRESAHMVGSLGYSVSGGTASGVTAPLPSFSEQRQLTCQIWSLSGALVRQSRSAPTMPLSSGKPGFSERTINGIRWRVYTYVDRQSGLRVMVGDTVEVRRQLVTDLVVGLLAPAVVGLAALAFLLWLSVGRGLVPLRRIAAAIALRGPTELEPLHENRVPAELAPLTQAIDGLLERLARLRASERQFLASAAHEMQTPLAGLKTHADIAARSPDAETRSRSLDRISVSVDRTTRLVRQLLDLARQESGIAAARDQRSSLRLAFDIIEDDLEDALRRHDVVLTLIDPAPGIDLPIAMDALLLALRNLVENAIIHGPRGGQVVVGAARSANGVSVFVEDQGAGLTAREAEECARPFIRGSGARGAGSGLGLAIARAALANAGMTFTFEQLDPTGFRVVAKLPAVSLVKAGAEWSETDHRRSGN
jgi:two-component system sensor histidine kinase QseC